VSLSTVFRKFTKWLTNIDGKTSNNIPEAVNKPALSARLCYSCETGWNKHDSTYYSKQNSKFYHRVKFWLCHLEVYDEILYSVTMHVSMFASQYPWFVLHLGSFLLFLVGAVRNECASCAGITHGAVTSGCTSHNAAINI